MAALLVVGIIIAILISGKVTRPIMELFHGTEEIEKGNLDYRVGTGAKDEIGRLSRAFDSMTQNLMKSTTSIDNLNREINERKRAEDALRETSDYLENLINYANAPIIVWNPEKRIDRFNHAFERFTGYKGEEVIGKKLDMLFPETSRGESLSKIENTLKGEYWESVEIPILCKDGDTRIALWNSANIYSEDGKALLTTIDQGQDITERKQAEEALRESEEKYRQLFELGSDALFLIKIQTGQILDINNTALEMYGYSREEALQMKNIDFSSEPDKTRKATVESDSWIPVRYHRKKDGTVFPTEISVCYFTLHGKEVCVAAIRDITKRKQAEEEIKSHQEHLALINKILRHDITNDLVVIQSAINLYNKSTEGELLEEISTRTGKSIELINRMRELESFISRHRELQMREIRNVIDEAIKGYPSVNFKIKGKAQVMADDSLSSVIDNIIGNAVIHGKADRITITTGKEEDMCEVRIADNGTGIPDEIKEKIFEEGYMHGDTGHTGIGLHIVEKAMEGYGGYAYVEGNEPKGTVFVLRFRMVK